MSEYKDYTIAISKFYEGRESETEFIYNVDVKIRVDEHNKLIEVVIIQ